ncbi:MAG: ATP-binding protein [Magnetococcus sp. DMHC-1]
MKSVPIKPREKDAILQALGAGVVPKQGLSHVQVGRAREVKALLGDIERIAQGGAAFRLIVGSYGSGKTFFLHLVRLVAMEKGLLVVNADLGPDRRLHATDGKAQSLYNELMRNLSTRTRPGGGALPSVMEKFLQESQNKAQQTGRPVVEVVRERLGTLEELVDGFDFASVLNIYRQAAIQDDENKKNAAIRWMRGEWSTRTEAKQALGVRSIINDAGFYDYLKLMGQFAVLAGYKGLLVVLDEMVNLFKLQSAKARTANYEQILRILNDVLQGNTSHIGFVLGGTPEFLMDSRRGLYSYVAMQSRLAENQYMQDGLIDMSGPVLRLAALTPEEILVLLEKIRHIFAVGDPERYLVPDRALTGFMDYCAKKIGEAYFRTPRTTIKAWVNFLAILEQNPGTSWEDILGQGQVTIQADSLDENSASNPGERGEDDDDLATFRI